MLIYKPWGLVNWNYNVCKHLDNAYLYLVDVLPILDQADQRSNVCTMTILLVISTKSRDTHNCPKWPTKEKRDSFWEIL